MTEIVVFSPYQLVTVMVLSVVAQCLIGIRIGHNIYHRQFVQMSFGLLLAAAAYCGIVWFGIPRPASEFLRGVWLFMAGAILYAYLVGLAFAIRWGIEICFDRSKKTPTP